MREKINKNIILLLLSLTMFLVVLDSAIVNVALPAIKTSLGFDDASLQWVLTAYIIAFGGFLMLGGRTADLFGRRKVLTYGIFGFTISSLLIGLSQSSEMMVIMRAFQGLSAAFMAPTALSILLTTFEEGHERNKALSIWGLVASGGAASGVFLGGVLTQFLGWEWCFFVNVPVGFLAIYGINKYIPAHAKESKNKNLDIPGAILITLGLISLVYSLTLASEAGWTDAGTLTWLGTSILLLSVFIFNETKASHPLVPLGIFKNRNLSGGNLIMLPIVAGALGQFFFLTLYIQNILQYSPVITGLSFLPVPLIIGTLSYNAPKLMQRFNVKHLLVTGTICVTFGVFLFSFLTENSSYWTHLLPAFIIMAFGFGLSFVSITVAATNGIPPHEAGLASGLLNTSQQVGGALGLAVLSVVAHNVTAGALAAGQTVEAANLLGYQRVFLTASSMMLLSIIIAIFVIQTPKKVTAKPTAVH
jgi:EmrB/QacA subfamily drug resistance transporter